MGKFSENQDTYMEWEVLDSIHIYKLGASLLSLDYEMIGIYMCQNPVIIRWSDSVPHFEIRGKFEIIDKDNPVHQDWCYHLETEYNLQPTAIHHDYEYGTSRLSFRCPERGNSIDIFTNLPRIYETDGTDITPPNPNLIWND